MKTNQTNEQLKKEIIAMIIKREEQIALCKKICYLEKPQIIALDKIATGMLKRMH